MRHAHRDWPSRKLILADATARHAARGGRLHDAAPYRCRSTSRSPRRSRRCSAAPRPNLPPIAPGDDRDDPVHLGFDRPRQGRGLDPSRGDHRRLCLHDRLSSCSGSRTSEGERRPNPPSDPGQRAAVPRHRRGAGAAQQLRHRPDLVLMPKWDPGEAMRLIEQREDHLFRRRADDEPRAHAASRPRRIRPVDADRLSPPAARRVRSSMSSGSRTSFKGAQPALGYGLTETNAVGCGNFWTIITTSRPRPAARSSRSSISRSWARATGICPPASAARSRIRSACQLPRLLARRGGDRAAFTADGYFAHRRHRLSRRGRLSVHRRPQEGHHHPRRREYQRPGGRSGDLRPSGGLRGRRVRRRRRAARRGPGRRGLQRAGRARPPKRCAPSSPRTWPSTSCPPGSGFQASPCPSSAPARSTRSPADTYRKLAADAA